MEKKFKIFFIVMIIPIVTNLVVTISLYFMKGVASEFLGYALGTALSIIYIAALIFQAKKLSNSNTMTLLKVFAAGFVVKLAALFVSMFVVWKTAPLFSLNYFITAFMWVLLLASAMEIVFYYISIKPAKK